MYVLFGIKSIYCIINISIAHSVTSKSISGSQPI